MKNEEKSSLKLLTQLIYPARAPDPHSHTENEQLSLFRENTEELGLNQQNSHPKLKMSAAKLAE